MVKLKTKSTPDKTIAEPVVKQLSKKGKKIATIAHIAFATIFLVLFIISFLLMFKGKWELHTESGNKTWTENMVTNQNGENVMLRYNLLAFIFNIWMICSTFGFAVFNGVAALLTYKKSKLFINSLVLCVVVMAVSIYLLWYINDIHYNVISAKISKILYPPQKW